MIQAIHSKIATPGPGYLATSATSLTIAASGAITLATQAGLAYTVGARVRVTYSSDTSKWMEGVVSSYAGTSLAFAPDTSNGSGTFASWNINLAGQPGAATAVAVGATTTGAAGTSASVANSGTAYSPTLNFTIPRGDTGATGASSQWRSGAGAPAAGTGNDGDMYLDSNTGDVYGPKAGGAWGVAVENIVGPAGSGMSDPGANGITKRTALNTLAVAVAGTDYVAPGGFGWIALPTLQNSWAAVNTGTYGAVVYGIDSLGIVRTRGMIGGGTVTDGTLLFTLPVGYRPAVSIVLLVSTYTGAANSYASLLVGADGTVKCYGLSAGWQIHIDIQFPNF